MTDEERMMAVKTGDLRQMSPLFERYKSDMFRFFYRHCNIQSLSEDLTQNVFERIIQYRHSYKESGKFRSWMYSIAMNVWHDEAKRFAKNESLKHNYESEPTPMSQTKETQIIEAEELAKAKTALGRLSDEAQQIICLNWYDNLRYAEIGKILKMTEGSVRVKMHRALKKLRVEYNKIEM